MTTYRWPDSGRISFVVCERCGGDGGWSVEHTHNPFTDRIGYRDVVCPDCDGAGEIEVEFAPLTMDEALEADGEKLRQLTGEDHGPFDLDGH